MELSKKNTQTALNRAIRKGEFSKASRYTCLDCTNQASDYDHHKGYGVDFIFVVQPVCRKCHVARERKRNKPVGFPAGETHPRHTKCRNPEHSRIYVTRNHVECEDCRQAARLRYRAKGGI